MDNRRKYAKRMRRGIRKKVKRAKDEEVNGHGMSKGGKG